MATAESLCPIAFAEDEEVSVFVSTLTLADACCISLPTFLLVCVEHAKIRELINKTTANNFPMTSHL